MAAALAASFMGQLEEFYSTLDQNGRAGQAEEISQLLYCVKSMQDDLVEAVEEVGFLREQIEAMEKGTMKARLGRMQEDVQRGISQAVIQMKMVEAQIQGGIRKAMDSLKEKGIDALERAVDAAHVYQGLDRAESFLAQAMEGMEQKMKAVSSMPSKAMRTISAGQLWGTLWRKYPPGIRTGGSFQRSGQAWSIAGSSLLGWGGKSKWRKPMWGICTRWQGRKPGSARFPWKGL